MWKCHLALRRCPRRRIERAQFQLAWGIAIGLLINLQAIDVPLACEGVRVVAKPVAVPWTAFAPAANSSDAQVFRMCGTVQDASTFIRCRV